MHLTFVNVILLNRTGMVYVSNVSIKTHIFVERLFTPLALLLNSSLRDVNSETVFLLDSSESARSILSLAF